MSFHPNVITKTHVLQAIGDIDKNGLRNNKERSRIFFLSYHGKHYPPKYTIRLAHEFAGKGFPLYRDLNTTIAQQVLKGISDDFKIERI